MSTPLSYEINRRRTFGIISHPDAGKTTLTEKLLYFGGAIQVAGAVKSRKSNRKVTSDFMEIERQRGISVATSVMGFEYQDKKINILDTPGHQDFCEDTYRTLTAVDSVIMVIDHVKGVESQTEKLLEVCRMRKNPVITFINKLDREGNSPIETLDEIEKKLNISVFPLSWPIGMGKTFKGVYNLYKKELLLFQAHQKQTEENGIKLDDLSSEILVEKIGEEQAKQLREDVELIEEVYGAFDVQQYLEGKVTPIFFGSAMNNFGVKELLDAFIQIAPPPQGKNSLERLIEPQEEKFSGFVFKIHANMDPKHRNRLAFLKICSGIFKSNRNYHHVRLSKNLKFNNPTAFMAQSQSSIEEAYPGDIIGLYDSGVFKIGDTLTEGENLHFKGIPSFSPEIFRVIVNEDPMKTKQLSKGIEQLMDEGLAQRFSVEINNQTIIGTVGVLQFEVIQYRLKNEYQATCSFRSISIYKACWFKSENEEQLQNFVKKHPTAIAKDKEGNLVYLAESRWFLQRAEEDYPDIKFYQTSEMD